MTPQKVEQIRRSKRRCEKWLIEVLPIVKTRDTVRIEFDAQQRDRYSRLLGYVLLPNGKMLNEEIVRAGYAAVMTIE